MSFLLNVLWFIFGGFIMGLSWWLWGIFAYISIIGIPWGKACFVMGQVSFCPFGKEVVNRDNITQSEDIGTGVFGSLGNISFSARCSTTFCLFNGSLKKYRFVV